VQRGYETAQGRRLFQGSVADATFPPELIRNDRFEGGDPR
jgi:hypothetical protein